MKYIVPSGQHSACNARNSPALQALRSPATDSSAVPQSALSTAEAWPCWGQCRTCRKVSRSLGGRPCRVAKCSTWSAKPEGESQGWGSRAKGVCVCVPAPIPAPIPVPIPVFSSACPPNLSMYLSLAATIT
eukprot:CAMPEP_0173217318 /NCGR_PEP_ID=MMETSP1142-20121109/431_1 /TAXON_ID=483371 /ORGANISM="non described non described, Strain CCMP2298" /LENGTH=130 /DNA_ID=CAMNT_0014144889 /DNA_START=73 /DNA_END=465 /DNA_ORIENTATION=+